MNTASIPVLANSQVAVNCIAHAGFMQRVTLTGPGLSLVFQGQGEGVAMTLSNGETSYLIPQNASDYTIFANFEFSPIPPYDNYLPANAVGKPIVTGNPPFVTVAVTSEDSSDNDQNDSYLSLFIVTDSSGKTTSSEFRPSGEKTIDLSQAEMHCKTYYNAPNYAGGDEHYVTIPVPSDLLPYEWVPVPFSYSGLGWASFKGHVQVQETSLGGYIQIGIIAWDNENLLGAQLSLIATTSYWGSFPTGHTSATFEAALYDSPYKVTSVTP